MNTKNTVAALDAIQSNLNPAHLDRMPRPHDLLASDIASNVADACRYLADNLAEGANLDPDALATAWDALCGYGEDDE